MNSPFNNRVGVVFYGGAGAAAFIAVADKSSGLQLFERASQPHEEVSFWPARKQGRLAPAGLRFFVERTAAHPIPRPRIERLN